jgi:hypothetical protein
MATAASVVVGAAATKIAGVGAPLPGGNRVLIRNDHSSDKLVLGFSSAVSVANGFSVIAGATLDLGYIAPGETVWGIRGAAADITAQVLVLAS